MVFPSIKVEFPHQALIRVGLGKVEPVISSLHGLLPQIMAECCPQGSLDLCATIHTEYLDGGGQEDCGPRLNVSVPLPYMPWCCWCGTGMECVPNPHPSSTKFKPFPGTESGNRHRVVVEWGGQSGPGIQGGIAVGSENLSLGGSRRKTNLS